MAVATKKGGIPLQWQMLIGFVIGLVAGLITYLTAQDAGWVEQVTTVTGFVGQMFLRLLFMLVIPLLFSALVVGIAEMGDARSLKRVGLKTLAFTVIVSGIAVVLALAVANIFQPGAGVDRGIAETLLNEARDNAGAIISRNAETPSGLDALLAIIPSNVFSAMSANDILAVMFFALFFGIGLLFTDSKQADALQNAIEGVFHVTMKLILWVIKLAPIAVACFMFNLASAFGWDILIRLGAYVLVVLLALGLHMFVVYPLVLRLWGGVSPLWFFKNVREAMVMAFATASSNATLPYALKVADENLKLPRAPARFVLTIGATANQNGTAIFEGITVLFLAQFFGVDLSISQQVVVLLMCILGGIGTAGVPAGSLPVVALILAMVGVPPEGIGIVLGVDRFLDMCRTTLNVTGDLACATVVSKGEGDDGVAEGEIPEPQPAS